MLFYSSNQCLGIHSRIPNVNKMDSVLSLIIIINQFETTIHNLTTPIQNFPVMK